MGIHHGPRPSGNTAFGGLGKKIKTGADLAHIVTSVGTTTVNITRTDTYKVFVLGAGGAGSGYSGGDYAGDGGFFEAEIPFTAGDTLEIGVGQGGTYNGNSAQITGGSYVMRGGAAYQRRGYWAGDGGGGSN